MGLLDRIIAFLQGNKKQPQPEPKSDLELNEERFKLAQQATPTPAPTASPTVEEVQRTRLTQTTPQEYAPTIIEAAKKHGVDPAYLSSLLMQESSFDPDIIASRRLSPVGARGIAQFMPIAQRELENQGYGQFNPDNPQEAIPAAAFYLNFLQNKLKDYGPPEERLIRAIAAYNAGQGNIRAAVAKARAMGIDQPNISDLIKNNLLPTETANYVPKIQGYAQQTAEF